MFPSMTAQNLKKGILGLVLLGVGILVVQQSGLADWLAAGELQVAISQYGTGAPIIFMAVYALATLVFIPGTPLTLLGGALFGPFLGTLYVVVGATVGAVGAFCLARFFGGSLLTAGTSTVAKQLQKYDARLSAHGFMTVLILRLIPLFPFNGLNFGLGLTSLKLRAYAPATLLGIIPGTAAYVYFGASLASVDPLQITVAVLIILVLSIVGKYFLRTI